MIPGWAARALLADAAERTLDVRYYIWHSDMSGTMLFAALRRAADRGVRVRLLLDDNNTAGLEAITRRLVIELATVKNHVHNILKKLHVHRRIDAST